jgi:hypothetical protein
MRNDAGHTRAAFTGLFMGLLACGLSATTAQAVDIVPAPVIVMPGASAGDLQALQNRLSRQQFQNEQQRLRQVDRDAVTILPPPRRQVPRMKPGCQGQVYGTLADCR